MPENAIALLKEAEADYQARQFDNAQEKLKKIIETEPQNDKAITILADIYAVRGLISSVINQYFALINIFEAKGDLRKALEICSWILKLDPENINVRMKSILIYQKLGDKNETIRQSLSLARLLIELGQGDQSILLLQKTQEVNPENLEVGSELAEIYISYGHIPEAVAQYKKIAASYIEKGLINKASDVYKRLKLVVPEDREAMIALGKIFIELNQYKEAEAEFRSVLRLDLNNLEALMLLSEVCQKKGQYKDAILALTKVIAIDNQFVPALEKLGELYQEQGKIKEAVKNYINAAQNYQLLGNIEKAVQIYQKVLVIDSTNPVACRELTNLGAPLVCEIKEEIKQKIEAPEIKEEEIPPPLPQKKATEEKEEIVAEPIKEEVEVKSEKVEIEVPVSSKEEEEEFVITVEEEKKEEKPLIIISAKDEEELKKIKKEEVKVKLDKHLIKTGLIKEGAAAQSLGLIKERPSEEIAPEYGLIRRIDKEEAARRKTGLIKSKLISSEIKKEEITPPSEEQTEPEVIPERPSIQEEFLEHLEVKVKEEAIAKEEEITVPLCKPAEEEEKVTAPEIKEPEKKDEIKTPIPKAKPQKAVIDEKIFQIDKLLISGKASQAIEKCIELLSNNPDDDKVRFELGKIYLEKGLLSEALEIFNYLKQKDKENVEYRYLIIEALKWKSDTMLLLNQMYQLAAILSKLNRNSQLIKLYQDIILLDEDNIEVKKKLAELYLSFDQKAEGVFYLENIAEDYVMRKQISKAIEVYNKVYSQTNDTSIKEKLAYLYKANNNIKEAIGEYTSLAEVYSSHREHEGEIKAIQNIIELDAENLPSRIRLSELLADSSSRLNIENLFKIAVIYSKTGDKEKAKQYLEKVIILDENYVPAYDRLTDVCFALADKENALKFADILINSYKSEKRYKEAAEIYKRIISYDPENIKAMEELSKIYMLSEEKDKAIEELLTLIKTLTSKKEWDEVIRVYEKIIALDPDNFEYHFNLGLVYFESLGKFHEAVKEFENAVRLSPRNIKAGQYLLNVYLQTNQPYKAAQVYKSLLEIDFSFKGMEKEIFDKYLKRIESKPDDFAARYDLGVIYKELGKLDEAIEQFQQSKKQSSLLLKSYNMLGLCFAQKEEMGMFDLAVRQFKKALELKGYPHEEYLETKYNLGNLYFDKRMYQEAKNYFEEILKETPGYKDVKQKRNIIEGLNG